MGYVAFCIVELSLFTKKSIAYFGLEILYFVLYQQGFHWWKNL